MASQLITIAKLGGISGDIALRRLSTWAAAREARDPNLWSPDQWPSEVLVEVDEFAERLRAHALDLPVCFFLEWSDLWSACNQIPHWLSPPNCTGPLYVHANRFEVFGYGLPDEGRLAAHLGSAGPQQFPETDWIVTHLREAVSAWEELAPRTALVVLRRAVNISVLDEEVVASLNVCPNWLS